jgi:hypothetical protein
MYSDDDLQSAVDAGVIEAAAADALRAHIDGLKSSVSTNEENFRLVTGFNDIFVTIAVIIMLTAMWWIGNSFQTNLHDYTGPASDEVSDYGRFKGAGPILCAGTAWLLAEYFVRIRRMALPSIVLLIAMVVGVLFCVSFILIDLDYTQFGRYYPIADFVPYPEKDTKDYALRMAMEAKEDKLELLFENAQTIRFWGIWSIAAFFAAIAALLFWLRMRTPIAIAATVGMGAVSMLTALLYFGGFTSFFGMVPLLAALGLGKIVFGYAMWWDTSDRDRKTQRSDIAFWLHMLAAPLIAHALFGLVGVSGNDQMSNAAVITVLGLYAFFALVAIAVDRRALLVSALVYVLIAMTALFKYFGVIELGVAITAFVIGSALLLLSAFWGIIRRKILHVLPVSITARLPAAA